MNLEYWSGKLSGKSVCIVGNGPIGSMPPASAVDEHDVVIRFNDCSNDGELGYKTSIYCTTLRKEVTTDAESFKDEGVLVVYTGRHAEPDAYLSWSGVGHKLSERLHCWPSSGLMAVYLAQICTASQLTLVGMTLAPSLVREPSWHPRYAPPWFYHNFLGERRVLAEISRDFEGDKRLPHALEKLRRVSLHEDFDDWLQIEEGLNRISCMGNQPGMPRDGCISSWRELTEQVTRLKSSLRGVALCEPFLFLPTDTSLHHTRWYLYNNYVSTCVEKFAEALRSAQHE